MLNIGGKRFPVDPVTIFSDLRFCHPNARNNFPHYFSSKLETYAIALKKVRKKNIDFPASLNFLKLEKWSIFGSNYPEIQISSLPRFE